MYKKRSQYILVICIFLVLIVFFGSLGVYSADVSKENEQNSCNTLLNNQKLNNETLKAEKIEQEALNNNLEILIKPFALVFKLFWAIITYSYQIISTCLSPIFYAFRVFYNIFIYKPYRVLRWIFSTLFPIYLFCMVAAVLGCFVGGASGWLSEVIVTFLNKSPSLSTNISNNNNNSDKFIVNENNMNGNYNYYEGVNNNDIINVNRYSNYNNNNNYDIYNDNYRYDSNINNNNGYDHEEENDNDNYTNGYYDHDDDVDGVDDDDRNDNYNYYNGTNANYDFNDNNSSNYYQENNDGYNNDNGEEAVITTSRRKGERHEKMRRRAAWEESRAKTNSGRLSDEFDTKYYRKSFSGHISGGG